MATKTKTWLGITYVFIFAVVSPLGIGIGMILSSGDGNLDVPSVILQVIR